MYRTEKCILLKKIAYKSNQFILTILGEDSGKFSALAFGIKSQNKAHLALADYLNVLEIQFKSSHKNNAEYVNDIHLLQSFEQIRQDYDKLTLVFKWFHFLNRVLAENDLSDISVFHLLFQHLKEIDQNTELHNTNLMFKFKLLKQLGYQMAEERCNACAKSLAELFDYRFDFKKQLFCMTCCEKMTKIRNEVDVEAANAGQQHWNFSLEESIKNQLGFGFES